MGFAILVNHRVKIKENEKRDKNLDLARKLKKAMEHEGDDDTNCNWCALKNPQGLVKRLEDFEIRGHYYKHY